MQQIIDYWNTKNGKIVVLGGVGTTGFLGLCAVCAFCSILFYLKDNDRNVRTVSRETRATPIEFATEPDEIPEPTEVIEPTPTPTPESTPTPEPTFTIEAPIENFDPNYVLTLPQEIKNNENWVFTVNQVDFLETIDAPNRRHIPENGIFLWLKGTVSNFTNENNCINGDQFTLLDGTEEYEMSRTILDAVHDVYELDYPGFILGQCLDYDETVDSFLVFDIPKEATSLLLQLDESKIQLGNLPALLGATPIPVAPTNTPEPTAVPTPTREEYFADVVRVYGIFGEALSEIGSLLQQPDIANEQWRDNLVIQMAIVKEGHKVYEKMTPPPDLEEFHASLTDATSDCDQSIDHLVIGLEELDENELNISSQFVASCATKLDDLSESTEEMLGE